MTRENDAAIADAAANALTWYRAVAPDIVTVTVEDGWLTLTGLVADVQQRGAAERAVLTVRGVRGVSNALRVVRPPCAMPHAAPSR
jgi:osmotically-inducible protein OsmY